MTKTSLSGWPQNSTKNHTLAKMYQHRFVDRNLTIDRDRYSRFCCDCRKSLQISHDPRQSSVFQTLTVSWAIYTKSVRCWLLNPSKFFLIPYNNKMAIKSGFPVQFKNAHIIPSFLRVLGDSRLHKNHIYSLLYLCGHLKLNYNR